ncbi:DUF3048 domain-containing protein [Bacillus sp. FJAT-45350]|uniref:DUF3048 domain-containing protein n=1 Tax=Bacillus sp. FJAT-45350 TaxID=2011014 RepID=UPI000BB6DD89|nr:DUF3048 domain-containing protein [Bacillus sp. FJAT-45350]
MKHLLLLVSILLVGAVTLVACSEKEVVQEEPSVEVEPEEEPIEEEVIPQFKNTYPLTGIGTDDEINHRPVVVTVNNESQARPQTGLNEADLVYEVLAEGNITRFVAFYHSQKPENIGPVRSARPYMIELSNGYDAFFVTHGWSPAAHVMLERERKADYLQGLYHDGSLFQRSSGRRAPHNSYITYENVIKGVDNKGYKLEGDLSPLLFLEEDDEVVGAEAKSVTIAYYDNYKVAYDFDEEKNKYYRSSGRNGDVATKDYVTDEPVGVENVLIVEAAHRVLDDVGRRSIDVNSGGLALLLQNGKLQQVEWKNDGGRILPVKNGEVVKLVPGQTWINIIPTSPGIEQNVVVE